MTDGTNPGEDPVDPNKVVNKTHEKDQEGKKLGETIEWTVEITNIYNVEKVATVTELEGVDLYNGETKLESPAKITMKAGEKITLTAKHVITEEDILAGEFVNKVTVKFDGGIEPTDEDKPVPTEKKNGHITITKDTTSKPADEKGYVIGETISYEITVENDGNLTIKNIVVTDELAGIEIAEGEGYTINDDGTVAIESLEPGAKVVITATYTVSAADFADGAKEVVNVATAEGESPDPDEPDVPVKPGTKPEPIKEKDVTITADDKTKVYDKDPSTDPALTATVEGASADDKLNYTLSREGEGTAEGQAVGDYEITVTLG